MFLRLTFGGSRDLFPQLPLGGFGIDRLAALTKGRYTIGLVSVAMFFVLSGFLICRSALRSRSVTRFLWHRFLCIFPAYLVFLVVFVAGTYLVMCNIGYGMNLRYTTMWDMPLRYLAMITVWDLTRSFGQRKELAAGIATTLLCVFDLRQYDIFFAQGGLYELVTSGLLHALRILK